ncbi:hypothetical protein [uncultured Phenylobacterium sp.]|uniref:terminase small subunit-like protein n=1 Tax=uncultured Phenylobacterium sp. TaxID=349273 RepID=UPI0025DE241D|nr:hypothetical protein [uncultured Phenylobacterium sp.]
MKPRVPYSPHVVDRICAGLEEGRGLRRLCREPGMPTRASVMRWLKTRPDFADVAALMRRMSGLGRAGRPSGYRRDLDYAICERLLAGEPLRTVCRDPAMPSRSTVHAWMRRDPEFARAIDMAREMAAWAAAEARGPPPTPRRPVGF